MKAVIIAIAIGALILAAWICLLIAAARHVVPDL